MLLLSVLLVSGAWAAKLDNTYLPPSGAASAGGYPGDIAAPHPFPGDLPPPPGNGFPSGAGGPPPGNGFPSGAGGPPPGNGFPSAAGGPPPGTPLEPQPPHEIIPIVSYNNQPNTGDGTYSFSYETANGIKAQEDGVLKQDVPEGPGEAVHGIYAYTGPDGVVYTVAYTADENGFVAKGDHLPTAPPVPPEIQAALEQNAAEEATAQTGYPPATSPSTPAQIGYFKNYPFNYNYNQNQNQRYYRRF